VLASRFATPAQVAAFGYRREVVFTVAAESDNLAIRNVTEVKERRHVGHHRRQHAAVLNPIKRSPRHAKHSPVDRVDI
jgi:cysteine sulfinate desulfinase/cysteine desulfurase-like protein